MGANSSSLEAVGSVGLWAGCVAWSGHLCASGGFSPDLLGALLQWVRFWGAVGLSPVVCRAVELAGIDFSCCGPGEGRRTQGAPEGTVSAAVKPLSFSDLGTHVGLDAPPQTCNNT